MLRVAVIGAGMAGLSCAARLVADGCRVDVFEKSRSTGGRLDTRREHGTGVDLGAQYFTVRDPHFAAQIAQWERAGAVARWEVSPWLLDAGGRLLPAPDDTLRWVGKPSMTAISRQLAGRDVVLCTQVAIDAVERRQGQWRLFAGQSLSFENFDALVVSVPAPQALRFLHASPPLEAAARSVVMEPCWSVAIGFDAPLELAFDAVFARGQPVGWLARNSSKPGRESAPETWVLHAAPTWSEERLESPPDAVARHLQRWFCATFDRIGREPAWLHAQCWRFARSTHGMPDQHRYDAALQLGVCGDWCAGGRVEGAWLSGRVLAERILAGHRL